MKIPVKFANFLQIILLIGTLASCSNNDTPVTTVSPPEPIPYPYVSDHFTFYYTSYDSLYMHEIADSVENNYNRILSDLLTDSVAKTIVHFYSTHEDLANAVRYITPNLPAWAIGLATAKDTIHMIAPKHPEQNYEFMLVVLNHEFTHCVTLNIKPNFGNNPRWLWESIALYEAGQFVHPNQLPYMVNHNPPTLSQLNNFNNTQIYQVGYLLSEYIILNWDRQHLKDMILSNGNIQQTLGISISDFQINWFEFVKNRYNI
jgi:hypothetical protein